MSQIKQERTPRFAKKKSMQLYYDTIEYVIEDMTDQEVGSLFKALFYYDRYGEDNPPTDRALKQAYNIIKTNLDRDLIKYQGKCEKAKESQDERWRKDREVKKLLPGEDIDERIAEALRQRDAEKD